MQLSPNPQELDPPIAIASGADLSQSLDKAQNVTVADKYIALRSPDIDRDLSNALNVKVIPGLDAVRAIAVTLVLVFHFGLIKADTGPLGVMIFFVLSGFLITAMLLKEYRKTATISLRNFYRRRAFRIFPTFYVCWIISSIVNLLAHSFDWVTAAFSFFYMMDYWRALAPDAMRPAVQLGISWSLAIEEKFYLLWPLLLLTLFRKRLPLVRTVTIIILGQWIFRAILVWGFHLSLAYVYDAFEMRADALLTGCLLAIMLAKEETRRPFSVVLRWQWLALIPALALVLTAMYPAINRYWQLIFWTAQPPIIAVLLVQFIYWGAKSWRICSSAPVRFTAHISYALYLYHPLAGQIVYLLHLPHVGYSGAALTLLMSIGSYYLVERPFMRMRDRAGGSHSGPLAIVQTAS
jgi:peptidoglycan/LPS O-acetylase OafA/YrhL